MHGVAVGDRGQNFTGSVALFDLNQTRSFRAKLSLIDRAGAPEPPLRVTHASDYPATQIHSHAWRLVWPVAVPAQQSAMP
jgi:hypothetical protein